MERNSWYQAWLTPTQHAVQPPILLVIQPASHITELVPDFKADEIELIEFPHEGKLSVKIVHEALASIQTAPVKPLRLVWIPQAERLASTTANAMLKTLEEAPAGNRFLLSTAYPGRMLPTIRSRCRIVREQRTQIIHEQVAAPHFDPKRKQDITPEEAHALALEIQQRITKEGITPEIHRSLQRLRDYYKITALTPGNKLASDALLATLLKD